MLPSAPARLRKTLIATESRILRRPFLKLGWKRPALFFFSELKLYSIVSLSFKPLPLSLIWASTVFISPANNASIMWLGSLSSGSSFFSSIMASIRFLMRDCSSKLFSRNASSVFSVWICFFTARNAASCSDGAFVLFTAINNFWLVSDKAFQTGKEYANPVFCPDAMRSLL